MIKFMSVLIACITYASDSLLNNAIVAIMPFRLDYNDNVSAKNVYSCHDDSIFKETVDDHSVNRSCLLNHQFMVSSSYIAIGFLFGAKAIVQILLLPIVRSISNCMKFHLPLLLFGVIVQLVSAVLYSFSDTFWAMFAARCCHGVGTSFTDPAAMILATDFYQDQANRMMIICLLSVLIAVSNFLGPLYGGYMEEHVGKGTPFSVLAILCFVNVLLILIITWPVMNQSSTTINHVDLGGDEPTSTNMSIIIADRYVILCCVGMFASLFSSYAMKSTIAIWMKYRFNSTETEVGYVYAPSCLCYLAVTLLTAFLSQKCTKKLWILATIFMTSEALISCLIPFATSYNLFIAIFTIFIFNASLADVIIYSNLHHVINRRHQSNNYKNIYSVALFSYKLCFSLAPIVGSALFAFCGFAAMMFTNALLTILCAPWLLFLRSIYDSHDNNTDLSGQLTDNKDLHTSSYSYLPSHIHTPLSASNLTKSTSTDKTEMLSSDCHAN